MATWHQQRSKARLFHDTEWSVVSDPPNQGRSITTFATEAAAKKFLAISPRHSYILPPAAKKNPRNSRGRFTKKRYASPSETRAIFDRMYARGDAEREAHLRTPAGEAERQAHNRRTVERLRKNPRNDTAVELALFIENDGQIYRSQTLPIIKNLQRKIAKGTYNPTLALKLWRHLADRGAHDYFKQHGSPHTTTWFQMFSTRDRADAAKLLADTYQEHVAEPMTKNPKQLLHGYFLYNVGDRIELHPATDWWMRGARYGEVRKVNPPIVTVKLDKVKRLVKVHYDNVLKVISAAGTHIAEPSGGWNKVTRVRKNPRRKGGFMIVAVTNSHRQYFWTGRKFNSDVTKAKTYRTTAQKVRAYARTMLKRLPPSIAKLEVKLADPQIVFSR